MVSLSGQSFDYRAWFQPAAIASKNSHRAASSTQNNHKLKTIRAIFAASWTPRVIVGAKTKS